MEYKKIYSQEELDDVVNWAKENFNRLPQSLRLDKGTYIPDLHTTMEAYIEICEKHKLNPTYGAQIRHIFMMRDRILEENLLLPE